MKQIHSRVVHFPAVVADLAAAPGERAQAGHPHHGLREVPPERVGVRGVEPDESVRDAEPAGEQLLVGVEDSPAPQQRGEVGAVESRRRGVERREAVVAAAGGARAHGPQRGGEGAVQGGGLVVEAVPEVCAAGEAQRVASGQHDEVLEGEAVRREVGGEAVQAEGRRRDAVVRRRLARRPRVPAAQRHVVRRASQLRMHGRGWEKDHDAFTFQFHACMRWTGEGFGACNKTREVKRTNRDDGVTCRDGDDVGTGDHIAPAGGVDGALDAVDHVEAADGVGVGRGHLLAGEEGRVVEQDGPVAPLNQAQR